MSNSRLWKMFDDEIVCFKIWPVSCSFIPIELLKRRCLVWASYNSIRKSFCSLWALFQLLENLLMVFQIAEFSISNMELVNLIKDRLLKEMFFDKCILFFCGNVVFWITGDESSRNIMTFFLISFGLIESVWGYIGFCYKSSGSEQMVGGRCYYSYICWFGMRRKVMKGVAIDIIFMPEPWLMMTVSVSLKYEVITKVFRFSQKF